MGADRADPRPGVRGGHPIRPQVRCPVPFIVNPCERKGTVITELRSLPGQRDALPAHRRGVRRGRGIPDRAGAGGCARQSRTSSGPQTWRVLSPSRPRCRAGHPGQRARRTRSRPDAARETVSHRCCRASCAARTPLKGCAASLNGARHVSPATDRFRRACCAPCGHIRQGRRRLLVMVPRTGRSVLSRGKPGEPPRPVPIRRSGRTTALGARHAP
jgi:hypothetical protein